GISPGKCVKFHFPEDGLYQSRSFMGAEIPPVTDNNARPFLSSMLHRMEAILSQLGCCLLLRDAKYPTFFIYAFAFSIHAIAPLHNFSNSFTSSLITADPFILITRAGAAVTTPISFASSTPASKAFLFDSFTETRNLD